MNKPKKLTKRYNPVDTIAIRWNRELNWLIEGIDITSRKSSCKVSGMPLCKDKGMQE
jgi:hypothetical protein